MKSTETSDSANMLWEIKIGAPLVIAFTGQARGLNELANFEFVKSTRVSDCSKIFCRDPNMSFYHLGIDDSTSNIREVCTKLSQKIEEMQPSKVTCVGVSAGGFASLLFGHMLRVDRVHAFGPQTILHEDWGIEHDDSTIRNCKLHNVELAPENDFRDLQKVLSSYNGKTKYKVHVGRNCQQDLYHLEHIQDCPGVEGVLYDGEAHACATHILNGQGRLGTMIMED